MSLIETIALVEVETADLSAIPTINSPGPRVNSAFSKINPSLQLAWDSTSLGAMKTCPKYYDYAIRQGYRARGTSVHLTFGIEFHAGLELYDRLRAEGKDHHYAMLETVRSVFIRTWDSRLGRPWISDDPNKNRETLIRTIVWYLDHFADDPLETIIRSDGQPCVELSFRMELDLQSTSTGEGYLLCGHIDRLAKFQGKPWIVDRKAQPKTCKVLGYNGWVKIGDLNIGDMIAGRDGNFYPVKALYPKGITKVYKVIFSDNTYTFCAEDHLWEISGDGVDVWRTVDFHTLLKLVKAKKRFHVPVNKPVKHPEKHLEMDPYILGALLGDGHLAGGSIQISTSNEQLIENIRGRLPPGDIIRKNPANNLVWTITGNRNCHTLNAIKLLELKNCLSRTKFIPTQYLYASVSQRRDLLQGLLDTDGSFDRIYQRYQSMSKELAEGVCQLVRSLGGSALLSRRTDGVYRVGIRMYGITDLPPRRRYVRDIVQVEDAETVCIEIDSSDHLYITDEYIVTHNTSKWALGPEYFAGYSPDNQMSLYDLAGTMIYPEPIQGIIIDAAQVGVTYSRFQRGFTARTPSQREEWLSDTEMWLRMAEVYAIQNHWPRNDKNCKQFGRDCDYRPVCAAQPEIRQQLLDSLYTRFTWDPLQVREA